jgi:transmembrane sensor
MDELERNRSPRGALADEAAEWLIRLEDASPEEKREFVRWLKSSKDAADEVLLAKSTDILLRQLLRQRPVNLDQLRGEERNVVALSEAQAASELSRGPSRRARSRTSTLTRVPAWAWVSSAGVALAAVVVLAIFAPGVLPQWLHPNVYSTAVGEQRSVQLMDGSVISINATSRLRVSYSEQAREIFLESGQAIFIVSKDEARPFRVHAGNSVVQAVGTKFDVRRRSDRVSIAVIEGIVQITTDAPEALETAKLEELDRATRVAAGEAVSVVNSGLVTPPIPINVADVSAWQQRRLVFADNTLAEISEEFARYNRKPYMRVEGEALRARRFSGVFDADSPEALLAYLAADKSLEVEREGDEIVIRVRPIIVQSNVEAP